VSERATKVAVPLVVAAASLLLGSSSAAAARAPDLVVSAVSKAPKSVVAGSRLKVRAAVANRAGARAGTSRMALYLSSNARWSSSDTELAGSGHTRALASRRRIAVMVRARMPRDAPPAHRFMLLACADVRPGWQLQATFELSGRIERGLPDPVDAARGAGTGSVEFDEDLVTEETDCPVLEHSAHPLEWQEEGDDETGLNLRLVPTGAGLEAEVRMGHFGFQIVGDPRGEVTPFGLGAGPDPFEEGVCREIHDPLEQAARSPDHRARQRGV
jgi:hypothetical protein